MVGEIGWSEQNSSLSCHLFKTREKKNLMRQSKMNYMGYTNFIIPKKTILGSHVIIYLRKILN